MKASLIYPEWLEAIQPLNAEERGELFTLILQHTAGEETVPTSPVVAAAWGFVRASIDANNDRYEELCERRRAAGRKGGLQRAASAEQANEASASKAKQSQANEASASIQNQNQNQNQNQHPIKGCGNDAHAPAREDVVKFFLENSATIEQADRFFNYWEAAGWIRGSTPLKAWQPSARQWILEDYRKQSQQPKTQENGRKQQEIARPEDFTDRF